LRRDLIALGDGELVFLLEKQTQPKGN